MWIEFMQPGGEHAKLYSHFLSHLNGDDQTAKDCLQETLMRFFNSVERGTFDYRRKVMPYLWRIAVNVLNDCLRKSFYGIPFHSLEAIEADRVSWSDRLQSGNDAEAELINALDHLAKRAHLSKFQRQVMLLCHIYDLKPREAATFLKVSSRKVSNELFRARKKIQQVTHKKDVGKGRRIALGE